MLEPLILNKLILLFVFDRMGVPMQENVLVDMATDNNWISYMDCKESLCDLIKTSFIANMSPKSHTPRFAITSDGRECLKHFYTQIPLSLRDEITENVKENRLNYRKKQDYISDYYKNPDGTFTVVLRIDTTNVQLMELKLVIQSISTAKWVHKTWAEKAPQLYETILDTLID